MNTRKKGLSLAKNIFSRTTDHTAQADSVVVIGLGRFGGSLALELEAQGTEVLGIDVNEDIVQSLNGRLTHVVRADSTKEEVLRQLSVHEFDRAVVGIGTDIEASILTTSRLLTFKHPQIWAKAISEPHAEILAQLGVEHVIRPEHDMGKRVAHLLRGSILDYVEFEDDFVMIRTTPPAPARDRPLGVLGLREKYGITIVAVKRPGGAWGHTTAQTVLYDDDQIIVQGTKSLAEKFSTLS
jgi:trk system potassium uptake protein